MQVSDIDTKTRNTVSSACKEGKVGETKKWTNIYTKENSQGTMKPYRYVCM